MYITNKLKKYSCTGYYPTAETVQFLGVEGVTLPISGEIKLISEDNDLILAIQACSDYARQTYENGVLTLTNEPEPVEPTAAELLELARSAALTRINGKCSVAIEAGVTVDGKHYRMKATDQTAINAALALVGAGEPEISYAADDGVTAMFTPDAIRAIARAAYKRGLANRAYNSALYAWVGRETDAAELSTINYGSALPKAYAKALTVQLTAAGIDPGALTEMLAV